MEIAGILIMAVACLILLGIVTHDPGDYGIVRTIPAKAIFSPEGPALQIHNGLGVIGAYISYLFVTVLFGYMSAAIPLLLFALGWTVFRGKDLNRLSWPAAYGSWCMVLLSTLFGWIYNRFEWISADWAGSSGVAVAQILHNITGPGSIVILLVLFLSTLLVTVDRDLQKTVDAMKRGLERQRERRSIRRDERLRRREEKARLREEKRAEKERLREQRREEKAAAAAAAEAVAAEARAAEAKVSEALTAEAAGKETAPESADDAYEKIVAEVVEEESLLGDGRGGDPAVRRSEDALADEVTAQEELPLHEIPRAVLGKPGSPQGGAGGGGAALPGEEPARSGMEGTAETGEDEDDVEISVFVGEGDEAAEERALDRLNKSKAKEIPVIRYKFPTVGLLDSPPPGGNHVDMEEIRENKRIILDKLKRHKIDILSINAIVGPTVTLYELEPAPEVKISRIQSYANDLKMATAAHGLRIIAPIPGRSAVGIEVPNSTRETVYIRNVINTKKFVDTGYDLPVAFGKTIENEVFMLDLTRLPHLLMAGATGSGKSVGINTIITCLLYKCHPDDLKFVMIDPKKIELSLYRNIQNHYLAFLPDAEEPIVTDTSKAMETLQSVCREMDDRYELLKMAMVRDIKSYNAKFKAGELEEELGHRHLPYIVVIIDELADLMMTAGKQIEEPIARLAQLARAIGIHLVVATQRPSVNVITGTIKANFPARIAYQVASRVDSRTILDVGGADQLVGQGDLLYTNGGTMVRLQNAFVSTEEVERITSFIGSQAGYRQPYYLPAMNDDSGEIPDPLDEIDELFEAAARTVILHQQGSVSLLQRKLKIGYNRAGRIVDQLYHAGIVGPPQGSTAREVRIESDEELEQIMSELNAR